MIETEFWGEGFSMNEVLNRLSEIEEQADAILCAAAEKKETMNLQLTRELEELARFYDRQEQETVEQQKEQRVAELKQRLTELEEKNRAAKEAFTERFDDEKELLAEQLVRRILGEDEG